MAPSPSCEAQREAQELNNAASDFIDNGDFQAAINNLLRALKLTGESEAFSESMDDMDSSFIYCSCYHCSLDYCMSYSQTVAMNSKTQYQENAGESEATSETGYVYRRPVRIPPKSMEDVKAGHSMGLVLPLLLTFNLALAHHLSVMSESSTCRNSWQRVLKLYELAYRWQVGQVCDEQVDSLRFSMAIANNLGQIHRIVHNYEKHQKCMQHLLSTMMFLVVDCDSAGWNETSDMFDGFLRNTAELVLQGQCAGAA